MSGRATVERSRSGLQPHDVPVGADPGVAHLERGLAEPAQVPVDHVLKLVRAHALARRRAADQARRLADPRARLLARIEILERTRHDRAIAEIVVVVAHFLGARGERRQERRGHRLEDRLPELVERLAVVRHEPLAHALDRGPEEHADLERLGHEEPVLDLAGAVVVPPGALVVAAEHERPRDVFLPARDPLVLGVVPLQPPQGERRERDAGDDPREDHLRARVQIAHQVADAVDGGIEEGDELVDLAPGLPAIAKSCVTSRAA
jgi:hypothetical protein